MRLGRGPVERSTTNPTTIDRSLYNRNRNPNPRTGANLIRIVGRVCPNHSIAQVTQGYVPIFSKVYLGTYYVFKYLGTCVVGGCFVMN